MTVMSRQAEVFEEIAVATEADTSDRRNCGEAWLRLASRHARQQDWKRSSAAAQSSINALNRIVETPEVAAVDQLNLAEAELLVVTIQIQDGSVTDTRQVEDIGRRLNEVSRILTVDELAELKLRIALLTQQCQRLIETAPATE